MKINIEQMSRGNKGFGWTSSKGNQNKWYMGGIWYKEDGLGYEALAEVLISRLLDKTNTGFHVHYEYEPLERNGCMSHGCRSENFMEAGDDKLVSVERLFQAYRGESASKAILRFTAVEDRIRYVTQMVESFTGLSHFGYYLKKIVTIDALFLNEDRHFHNIAVIRKKDGTYRECPVFDNGASLFSDVRGDYPLSMELEHCFEKIRAKPFSNDFDAQLDACDVLYGGFRFRADFTMKDVEAVLKEFDGIYEDQILERVRETMRYQIRKYAYLFY